MNFSQSLKTTNWKMFLPLLLQAFIPIAITTFGIYLIGQIPDSNSFSIASQLQWVSVFYEILQEAMILPLFFILGKFVKDKVVTDRLNFQNRIQSGLLSLLLLYISVSTIFIATVPNLASMMKAPINQLTDVIQYIRLEAFAIIFAVAFKFMMVIFILLERNKTVWTLLAIQLIATIGLNMLFVSEQSFSLQLGVNGIAYSNIIVQALLFFTSLVMFQRTEHALRWKRKLSFSWLKESFKVGGISGVESLIRNLVFALFIINMFNAIGESGIFWVANSVIWGWILLPILTLGELVKKDSTNAKDILNVRTKYMWITLLFVGLWLIALPFLPAFLQSILKLEEHKAVFHIIRISLPFYILFAFNNVIDSIFYGLGKTQYLLYQAIIVNVIYYGIIVTLFNLGVFVPAITSLSLIFAGGIALDSLITLLMFSYLTRKNKLTIQVMA